MKKRKKSPRLIIDKIMKEKGLSNSDLSNALGLKNPSSAHRFKVSQKMTFPTMIKIAKVLKVKVRDLIEE